MRVIVTGGAGFIGANIVSGLNRMGIDDIIVVDDLTDGSKYANLVDNQISDYVDKDSFYGRFARGDFGKVEAVFHEGACSDTMEHDGRFMLDNNYRCSLDVLESCVRHDTRLLYASSAATYGDSEIFEERSECERPRNVYGYSKLLFDNILRRRMADLEIQVAGFRYFNVFGPYEQHKGRMASVAYHHFCQMRDRGYVELFGSYEGYAAGQQKRDFVYVGDVVAVNLWFLENPQASGIFNLGTGDAQPFNNVAQSVINAFQDNAVAQPIDKMIESGLVRYIDFPEALKGKYQSFTQANIEKLRAVGYDQKFTNLPEAVGHYVDWLKKGGA